MPTAPHSDLGRIVDGRYRLGSTLGSGGMAVVHRAWDLRLQRAVAVKLFVPNADPVAHLRFHEEARTLAGLSHPGLLAVYDAGADGDRPYLVMQLVEGGNLRQRLEDGPLPAGEVRALGARLADTLAHVHDHGVIHRDVKPPNVLLDALLDELGRPYLADFGIARLVEASRITATGQFIGTAAYLAPEQVLGQDGGPPIDVYALGLVLLECLTGRTEYAGTDVEAAVARLHREPVVPDGVPPDLTALIAAMTARDPAARPTAAECAVALSAPPEAALAALSAAVMSPSAQSPVERSVAERSVAAGPTLGTAPAARNAAWRLPAAGRLPGDRRTAAATQLAAAAVVLAAVAWTAGWALDSAARPQPGSKPGSLVPAAVIGVVAPGARPPDGTPAPAPQQTPQQAPRQPAAPEQVQQQPAPQRPAPKAKKKDRGDDDDHGGGRHGRGGKDD